MKEKKEAKPKRSHEFRIKECRLVCTATRSTKAFTEESSPIPLIMLVTRSKRASTTTSKNEGKKKKVNYI